MIAGVEDLADMTPLTIERRMLDLLGEVVRIRGVWRNRTTQTVDNHRRELGTFFKWAKKHGYAKRNPVRKVERFEPDDLQWASRPFTPEEADRFFAAVQDPERLLVYEFWHSSGLRPGETERSRMSQLFLAPADGSPPFLRIRRSSSKNRKAVDQPLHPDVAAKLLARPERPLDASIFDRIPTCEEFAEDLARAGIPRGARADGALSRTSLRKCLATDLWRSGATMAQAQKILRHSRPELTERVYSQPELREKAALIARLTIPGKRPTA
jgi:integrase